MVRPTLTIEAGRFNSDLTHQFNLFYYLEFDSKDFLQFGFETLLYEMGLTVLVTIYFKKYLGGLGCRLFLGLGGYRPGL